MDIILEYWTVLNSNTSFSERHDQILKIHSSYAHLMDVDQPRLLQHFEALGFEYFFLIFTIRDTAYDLVMYKEDNWIILTDSVGLRPSPNLNVLAQLSRCLTRRKAKVVPEPQPDPQPDPHHSKDLYLNILEPTDGATVSNNFHLRIDSSEFEAGQVQVDSKLYSHITGSIPVYIKDLTPGLHKIRVTLVNSDQKVKRTVRVNVVSDLNQGSDPDNGSDSYSSSFDSSKLPNYR